MPYFSTTTATSQISTLSLHDALPICDARAEAVAAGGRRLGELGNQDEGAVHARPDQEGRGVHRPHAAEPQDRKSTRLNSSYPSISYAVFCLKKKKKKQKAQTVTKDTN